MFLDKQLEKALIKNIEKKFEEDSKKNKETTVNKFSELKNEVEKFIDKGELKQTTQAIDNVISSINNRLNSTQHPITENKFLTDCLYKALIAKKSNIEIVKMLVTRGATIEAEMIVIDNTNTINVAVGYEIIKGNCKLVESVLNVLNKDNLTLKKNKILTGKTTKGTTYLQHTCSSGLFDMALLLLENGAKPTTLLAEEKNTCLHLVCNSNALEKISGKQENDPLFLSWKKLVEKLLVTIDINSTNDDGVTPLHIVCSHRYANSKAIKFLLGKNANLTLSTKMQSTALHRLCANQEVVHEEAVNIFNVILEHNKSNKIIPIQTRTTTTSKHNKPKNKGNNQSSTKVNLASLMNMKDTKKMTPLYHLSLHPKTNCELIKLALTHGADPKIKCAGVQKITTDKGSLSSEFFPHENILLNAYLTTLNFEEKLKESDSKSIVELIGCFIEKGIDINRQEIANENTIFHIFLETSTGTASRETTTSKTTESTRTNSTSEDSST